MKRKTPYLYVVLALLAGAILGANPVRDVVRDGLVRDVARDITDVPFTTESAILSLSGMSYWVAGTETDSQNLTQLGSSGAGDAQFGSTSGADSNDPTSLPWYSTSDYDVTVDGVNYKYLSDNLVTNGTFDADYSGWDAIAAWSASDGVASIDGTGGSNGYSRQNILTVGKTYMVTFDITSLDAGYFDGWNGVSLSYGGTSTGTKSLVYTAAITHFYITGRSSAIGSIDNVVVREVTANLGDSVWLPGSASNFLSHPDSAAVSVTGDITIQVECALDDWVSGTIQTLVGKISDTTQRSYLFRITATGALNLYWSEDGATYKNEGASGTLPADGVKGFIRVTMDVDNGASDAIVRFWTSTDGETFTQFGSTQNVGAVTSIFDGTAEVHLGIDQGTTNQAAGSFYSAHIWNSDIGDTATGSAGTPVMHWEASSMTQSGGADEESGGTWTINRSASGLKSTLVTRPVIVFNSAASTYLEVADHDDLDLDAGDGTFWAYGRFHNMAAGSSLIEKETNAPAGYALEFGSASLQAKASIDEGAASIEDFLPSLLTASSASLVSGVRTAGSTLEAFLNGTGSGSPATDTGTDISNIRPLRIGIQSAPTPGIPINMELFAAGVLKGAALTADQLASLKTELDTLLSGRTGE